MELNEANAKDQKYKKIRIIPIPIPASKTVDDA
jgi:hypothetical protein